MLRTKRPRWGTRLSRIEGEDDLYGIGGWGIFSWYRVLPSSVVRDEYRGNRGKLLTLF